MVQSPEHRVSNGSYRYEESVKSRKSDEWINTHFSRPLADVIVRAVYPTSLTPNHLTLISTVAGLAAAWCISFPAAAFSVAAAVLIVVKDIFDSADGQLARAKNSGSRRGRFYDSLGDVIVNAALFTGIAHRFGFSTDAVVLAAAGFAGMTLRVSYHVYYHVMYLHLENKYGLNRPDETFRPEDLAEDPVTRLLHRLHLFVYGWQDRIMARLDRWCLGRMNAGGTAARLQWYGDAIALRISGSIGLATELDLLAVCALLQSLRTYLWLNLFLMNGVLLLSLLYRRLALAPSLPRS